MVCKMVTSTSLPVSDADQWARICLFSGRAESEFNSFESVQRLTQVGFGITPRRRDNERRCLKKLPQKVSKSEVNSSVAKALIQSTSERCLSNLYTRPSCCLCMSFAQNQVGVHVNSD